MRRVTVYFPFLFVCLLGLSWSAHLQSGDNQTSVATAQAIYYEGTMLIDESYQPKTSFRPTVDVEGKTYSRFGIGLPLLYLPVVALSHLLGQFVNQDLADHLLFSAVPLFFGLVLFFALFKTMTKLGVDPTMAMVLTFVSSVFTLSFRYMVHDHSEIIQASLFICALALILDKRQWLELMAFSLLALTVMIKTYNVAIYGLFGLFAIYQSYHHQRKFWRTIIYAGAPLLVTALSIGVLNYLRYGNALESGYGKEVSSFGFSISYFLRDFWALLFSFEMGFFTFSPLLILGVFGLFSKFKKYWPVASLAMGTATFLWLLSAFFYEPKGAWSLGPRYIVPSIPLLCLGLCFLNYQARLVRISFLLLLIPAAWLTPIYVLQKTQEYDVIRFNLSEDHTKLPAQIPGLAKLLSLKSQGYMDQSYPIAEFTGEQTEDVYNLQDYQTYRAVNTWYSHFSYKSGLPLRFPFLILHLALFLIAYLSIVAWLFSNRNWNQTANPARLG